MSGLAFLRLPSPPGAYRSELFLASAPLDRASLRVAEADDQLYDIAPAVVRLVLDGNRQNLIRALGRRCGHADAQAGNLSRFDTLPSLDHAKGME